MRALAADANADDVAAGVLQPLCPLGLAQPPERGVEGLRGDEGFVFKGLAVAAAHLLLVRIDALH